MIGPSRRLPPDFTTTSHSGSRQPEDPPPVEKCGVVSRHADGGEPHRTARLPAVGNRFADTGSPPPLGLVVRACASEISRVIPASTARVPLNCRGPLDLAACQINPAWSAPGPCLHRVVAPSDGGVPDVALGRPPDAAEPCSARTIRSKSGLVQSRRHIEHQVLPVAGAIRESFSESRPGIRWASSPYRPTPGAIHLFGVVAATDSFPTAVRSSMPAGVTTDWLGRPAQFPTEFLTDSPQRPTPG